MTDQTPNPGSPEARKAGCTCPAMDNARGAGRGTDEDGRELFVMMLDCPVHMPTGPPPRRPKS